MAINRIVIHLIAALAIAVPGIGTALAADPPKTSAEGLELVETFEGRVFYLRPGISFSSFDKLLLLDAFVGIDEEWLSDYNREAMRTRRLRDTDIEEIKERIKEGFWQTFGGRIFADGSYKEVAAVEPGALILRPAIIDVSVTSHDPSSDAMVQNLSSQGTGAMTLILEVYDASNSELVARMFSKLFVGDTMDFAVESETKNRADENKVFRQWADSFLASLKTH